MKKQTNYQPAPMDERQQQITGRAILFGFIFLVLCLVISTVYRIVTTGEAGWELFAIFGASLVILIARRIMGDIEQPLDYKNRPLPLGSFKADQRVRRRNYAVESTFFAGVCCVMDILLIGFGENENSDYELAQLIFPSLSKGLTIAITAVIVFGSTFLISYLINSLVGEWKINRYNKMLSRLDNEDDA